MRGASKCAAALLVLLLVACASGCAAEPFPDLPSPDVLNAAGSYEADTDAAEEIIIETIPSAQEIFISHTMEDGASVPEPEKAERESEPVAVVPETSVDVPEVLNQETVPELIFVSEEVLPSAQVIQFNDPEPELVSEPPGQIINEQPAETPLPQPAVSQPEIPALPSEAAQAAELETPVITLNGETLPGNVAEGDPFILRGIIKTSAGNLIKIHAALIDSTGKTVQQCIYAPGTFVFNLEGTVNLSLVFGSLAPGEYTYLLNAEASNEGLRSERELINHSFAVTADPARDAERYIVYTARFTNDTSNAGRVWNRFINEFSNPYAAAAILGNIAAESSFLPYLVEGDTSAGYSFSKEYTARADSGELSRESFTEAPGEEYGGGYGICQWTAERKGSLYDFSKASGRSVGDLDMQCDFIVYEMLNCYPDLYDYLRTADSCYSAVFRFCNVYEQAAIYGARNTYALQYLEKYGA